MIVKSGIHSFIFCLLDSSPTLVPAKSLLSFSRPHLLSRVLALFPSRLFAPLKRHIFAQLRRIYEKGIRFHPDGEKRERGSRQGTRRRGHVQWSRKDGGPGRLLPAAALPTGADGPVVPLRGEGWRSGEGGSQDLFASLLFLPPVGGMWGGAEGLNLTPSLGCPLSCFWETIPS